MSTYAAGQRVEYLPDNTEAKIDFVSLNGQVALIFDNGEALFPVSPSDLGAVIIPDDAEPVADYQQRQAVIVDAGQQVADLKAENARLREALKPFAVLADFNGWNTSVASGSNAVVYANDKGVLTRGNFEQAREALQPKEDKQS